VRRGGRGEGALQRRRGRRVGGEERLERELGERDVDRGAEHRRRADERERAEPRLDDERDDERRLARRRPARVLVHRRRSVAA